MRSQLPPVGVDACVVVLLRVHHPRHRVDPGKQDVDERAVLAAHRVDVRQVEDGDVAQLRVGVAHHRLDLEPLEQRPQLRAALLGHPRHGPIGGGTHGPHLAHHRAGERIQDR